MRSTGAQFHQQTCPVLSGIGAAPISDKARAVETLSRQLSETILWSDCMDAAAEAGITVALELGPGAALARMLQARHPQIACRSVADFRSLDGIVSWLDRAMAVGTPVSGMIRKSTWETACKALDTGFCSTCSPQ